MSQDFMPHKMEMKFEKCQIKCQIKWKRKLGKKPHILEEIHAANRGNRATQSKGN